MKKLIIFIFLASIKGAFGADLLAGNFSSKELAETGRKAIFESYSKEKITLNKRQVSRSPESAIVLPNDNESLKVELTFYTSYVRDEGSGVPDECLVTLIVRRAQLSVSDVSCAPYD